MEIDIKGKIQDLLWWVFGHRLIQPRTRRLAKDTGLSEEIAIREIKKVFAEIKNLQGKRRFIEGIEIGTKYSLYHYVDIKEHKKTEVRE